MHAPGRADAKLAASRRPRVGLRWAGLLILPAAAYCVFSPALAVPFAQDDFGFLWRALLHSDTLIKDAFSPADSPLYRPLVEIYFRAVTDLFGVSFRAFHLMALGILILDAWLVVLLGRRLGLPTGAALAAGYLYGCHSALMPLVLWASTAGSVLAVFWALVAILLTLRRGRWWWSIAPAAAFALSLLARESAATTPALACLCVWLRSCRTTKWQDLCRVGVDTVRRTWALWVVLFIYVGFRLSGVQRSADTAYEVEVGPHVVSNAVALVRHATGWPAGALPPVINPGPRAFAALAMAIAIIQGLRGFHVPLAGALWFLAGSLPVLFLSRQPMASYYVDVALIGPAIAAGAVAHGAIHWVAGMIRPAGRGGAALLLGTAALAGWTAMEAVTVRAEVPRSFITHQADRARLMATQITAVLPSGGIPPGGTLYLEGVNEELYWVMQKGDLFRIALNDPHLRVYVEGRDPPPPLSVRGRDFFAFRLDVHELSFQDISGSMRLPLVIRRLLPDSTTAGVGFNVQPDGCAAIAVVVEGAPPGATIVFGSTPLSTVDGGPDLLTALVPSRLYEMPGIQRVLVQFESQSSNAVDFVVKPPLDRQERSGC